MLAALASAVMPDISVAGVRASNQGNATDEARGIDHAVVQDSSGRLYDVHASDTEAGRKHLRGRIKAAQALQRAKEPAALGFAVDRVLASSDGDDEHGPTGTTAVMVSPHFDGMSRPLDLLTLDDCASVGTAIGAIHRLNPAFIPQEHYPAYATGQIRAQLVAWIKRLRQAGHIPQEITSSWTAVLDTDGLWSFSTCLVHGGFHDGDILFSGSTITSIVNWQDMQINDPARDLAWIFGKLDEPHRNAVLAAYGRMLGSRLDSLIMLRANLWLQMEQVGEFIQALSDADSQKIIQFKAQVERLAHQLSLATGSRSPAASIHRSDGKPPSTITVGTLLDAGERRDAMLREEARRKAAAQEADNTNDALAQAGNAGNGEPSDQTNETDRTGSAQIARATIKRDETADSTKSSPVHAENAGNTRNVGSSSEDTGDSTASRPVTNPHSEAPTIAIKPPSFAIRGIQVNNASGTIQTIDDDTRSETITVANAQGTQSVARNEIQGGTAHQTNDGGTNAARPEEGRGGQLAQPPARSAQSAQFQVQEATRHIGRNSNVISETQSYVSASVRVRKDGDANVDGFADSDAETVAFRAAEQQSGDDEHAPETILIPLLEREERAMRDARESLEAASRQQRHRDEASDVSNNPQDAGNQVSDGRSNAHANGDGHSEPVISSGTDDSHGHAGQADKADQAEREQRDQQDRPAGQPTDANHGEEAAAGQSDTTPKA
ncbi:aminoglycoside phosphotransferase [Bifidobacterium thermophilum RBL67]|uniref:Aminoglycoside phosphotransferase n=1 Tax=Bifidobacterium thermophilum RBL67 TaxID=1254439 RepID=M4RF50_9BIFI|nr:aminoglycoside phosphotransferase [Bifidobacterium thermophilum RBL67]